MIFEKICDMLVAHTDCDKSKITKETKLVSLGVDSLDTVEMIMDLAEELKVDLEFDEAVTTVGELVDFIERRLKEKGNA